jgi:exodeoxyribonuclease VIII
VIDLKSTGNASPAEFARVSWNMKMYIQAAWYIDSFERIYGTVPDFMWCAVESKPPYLTAFYKPPAHLVEYGREECKRLLTIYNECIETGVWAGYDSGINELVLPSWAENVISGGGEVEIDFVNDEEQT